MTGSRFGMPRIGSLEPWHWRRDTCPNATGQCGFWRDNGGFGGSHAGVHLLLMADGICTE